MSYTFVFNFENIIEECYCKATFLKFLPKFTAFHGNRKAYSFKKLILIS